MHASAYPLLASFLRRGCCLGHGILEARSHTRPLTTTAICCLSEKSCRRTVLPSLRHSEALFLLALTLQGLRASAAAQAGLGGAGGQEFDVRLLDLPILPAQPPELDGRPGLGERAKSCRSKRKHAKSSAKQILTIRNIEALALLPFLSRFGRLCPRAPGGRWRAPCWAPVRRWPRAGVGRVGVAPGPGPPLPAGASALAELPAGQPLRHRSRSGTSGSNPRF